MAAALQLGRKRAASVCREVTDAPRDDHGRRRRHAVLAAQPAEAAQAVPHPDRRPHAAPAGRSTASRPRCRPSAPGSSPPAPTATRRPGSCPALPAGPHRRRAVRPRHRRLHRPRRGPDRPAGPRRRHAGHAGRPRHRAGAGVPPGRPRRRADGRGAPRPPWSPSASRRRSRPPATATSTAAPEVGQPAGRRRLPRAGVPREAERRRWPSSSSPRGEYFWNSGIFVWKAATILDAPATSSQPTLHAAVQRIADAWAHAAARRGAAPRVRGAGEDQHRLRRDGARARRCWWCRPRTAGTTSAAGWPWSGCTRRTPTATPSWPRTAASRRKDCVIVGDPGHLIATVGVEQPAHHPGRRRHPGGRPPRRGRRSSSWSSC